jgi:hypothetical protein
VPGNAHLESPGKPNAVAKKAVSRALCCEEVLYRLRADEPIILIENVCDRAKQCSSGRRQYPIKRQDSQESCFGCLSVPPTIWIRTGDLFISKHFHRLGVRKRCRGALPLKVDVVAAFGAFEHESVRFVHGSSYQFQQLGLMIESWQFAPVVNRMVLA